MAATFTYPKCSGTGQVPFRHIANGRCFLCQGTGRMIASKDALAKAAKLGLTPSKELPTNQRCTMKQLAEITRLAIAKHTNETKLAVAAGVPEVNAMDNWQYELSRKQASQIIEYWKRI